jgi:hypothetical protein
MLRSALVPLAAALPFLTAAPQESPDPFHPSSPHGSPTVSSPFTPAVPISLDQSPCANPLRHEPVLVYEVTGGTLAGPIDLQLTVWGDGTARLCDASQPGGRAARVVVGVPEAARLFAKLDRDRAFRLCDSELVATDVPLHTLTIQKPATHTVSHTFSWMVPAGQHARIQQGLERFIQDNFPAF